MQIDNILENKSLAKHQTYLNMKDAFQYPSLDWRSMTLYQ